MNNERINLFLATKGDYFPSESYGYIKNHMEQIGEERELAILSANYISPVLNLILSIFVGGFGIDRFIIGDIGLGLGKLLLCCCCGVGFIWVIIDWFLIMNETKKKNLEKFMMIAG